jgi:hypothetical protein
MDLFQVLGGLGLCVKCMLDSGLEVLAELLIIVVNIIRRAWQRQRWRQQVAPG